MTKQAYTDIYFDFEFIDDGREIVPISLGMCVDQLTALAVYPAPQELYLEYQFDPARANDWVRENVFPHLASKRSPAGIGSGYELRWHVATQIKKWVRQVCGDAKPRFVGYYPSYDWVCLMQHWGNMMQKPKEWPMRPECLMQLADQLGVPNSEFPPQEDEHNALADAKWNRELHAVLKKAQRSQRDLEFAKGAEAVRAIGLTRTP